MDWEMKIIKTPWKKELMNLVFESKKSIKITSPFVKENICKELLNIKKKDTKLELITSFKLNNIHSGSLDLNGLENIISNKGIVKNHSTLHSKIYIFDDEKAIITSSNLTNGGLLNNFEYGFYTDDKSFVSDVVKDYNQLSNDENTGKVKQTDIDWVRKVLSQMQPKQPISNPSLINSTDEIENDIIEIPQNIIYSSLKGWKLEVYKCLESIPSHTFSLNEINSFEKTLQNIYPENNHIKDKIRQQLQYLRDLGLIEFKGKGLYKKLYK